MQAVANLMHEKATRETHKRDRGWFAAHPDRCFRIRRSVAFEDGRENRGGRLDFGFMLIRTKPDRSIYEKYRVSAKVMPHNDETFLSKLFDDMRAATAETGGTFEYTPKEHLAVLQKVGLA